MKTIEGLEDIRKEVLEMGRTIYTHIVNIYDSPEMMVHPIPPELHALRKLLEKLMETP